MMPHAPLTPERQLLKLIEGTDSPETLKMEAAKHKGLSFLSAGAWIGRVSFLKFKLKDWLKGDSLRRLDIAAINQILTVCALVLTFFFVVNLFASLIHYRKIPLGLEIRLSENTSNIAFTKPSILKAASYYLEMARSRDIFKMGEKKEAAAVGQTKEKPSSLKIAELTKNLRLVGISWSSDPDVMIEDTNSQRTFFLKNGQSIEKMGLKVVAVFKDKVVLSSEGEEIELR